MIGSGPAVHPGSINMITNDDYVSPPMSCVHFERKEENQACIKCYMFSEHRVVSTVCIHGSIDECILGFGPGMFQSTATYHCP